MHQSEVKTQNTKDPESGYWLLAIGIRQPDNR